MALSNIMTGALLSADTSRQIANVQHAVRKQMDGHAGKIWKLRELKRLPKRKKQRKLPGRRKPKRSFVHHTIRTTLIAGNMLY